jgi:hypothetical protein
MPPVQLASLPPHTELSNSLQPSRPSARTTRWWTPGRRDAAAPRRPGPSCTRPSTSRAGMPGSENPRLDGGGKHGLAELGLNPPNWGRSRS